MNQVGTNHHYVPQFLLRKFAAVKRNQYYVHTFDKQTGKVFRPNVRNIASEIGFYDVKLGSEILTFETKFHGIEDGFKEILEHIVETRSVTSLREEQRQLVSCFAAAQMVGLDRREIRSAKSLRR